MAKKVVSLGQCSADHGSISSLLRGRFHAEVVPAATFEEARTELRRGDVDLVLVNRVLDYTGEEGLAFVREMKADPALQHVPVMLVSNYAAAQQDAEAAGALPGFGKAALRDPETLARLRAVLGGTPANAEG